MLTPHRSDSGAPPALAWLGSAALHVGLGLLLLRSSASFAAPPPPETYRVKLVAMAAEQAPERQEPEPAEAGEEEHRPPPPRPTEEEKPETERPRTRKEEAPSEPSREPAKEEEEGEEAVNVQLEGATFPFPEYLQNIIRQVNRYWRPPTGKEHLRAEISFVIRQDGSITDVRWVQRSGNLAFDLEARGAIEAAGRREAFGTLPEKYPRDRLRVSFFFDPSVR